MSECVVEEVEGTSGHKGEVAVEEEYELCKLVVGEAGVEDLMGD